MAGKRMTKFLSNVRHDLRFYVASLLVQFKAATALRGAFAAQVIGMVLNDITLMIAWYFFFNRFGVVHGWGLADFFAMQGVAMVVFGIIFFISYGLMDLPRHVDSGSFDSFLTKPSSILGQLGSSNIDISTVGDILLGLGIIIWYIVRTDVSLLGFGLFLITIVSALIIFWCFAMLLPYILSFYIFDSERLSRYFSIIFLDTMNYPGGLLTGALRNVFLTAVPALLVGVVPVDVLRGLQWQWVGIGAVIAAFWLIATLALFKHALRRYESANLVGAR